MSPSIALLETLSFVSDQLTAPLVQRAQMWLVFETRRLDLYSVGSVKLRYEKCLQVWGNATGHKLPSTNSGETLP